MKSLLQLARKAIETCLTKKELDLTPYRKFSERAGVFVTLKKDDELRGCIGFITSQNPLYQTVVKAARAAAFDDPRFHSLEPEELGEIRVEISILHEPEEIHVTHPEEYLKKITTGRDGLIIRQGYRSGLLLPQVATEYGWNVETFLEHLCMKAGMPRDAWKDPTVKIERFAADILSEA